MGRKKKPAGEKGQRISVYMDPSLRGYLNFSAQRLKGGRRSAEVIELIELGIKVRDGATAMAGINQLRANAKEKS